MALLLLPAVAASTLAASVEGSLADTIHRLERAPNQSPFEALKAIEQLTPQAGAASTDLRVRLAALTVRSLLASGQVQRAEEQVGLMSRLAEQGGSPASNLWVKVMLLRLRTEQARLVEAGDLAVELLGKRKDAGNDDELEISLLRSAGWALYRNGKHEEGVKALVEAVHVAERTSRDDWIPALLTNLCAINRHLRNFPKALDYGQRAAALATKAGDRWRLAVIDNNLGLIYQETEQPAEASAAFHRALKGARDEHDTDLESLVLGNLASSAVRARDWSLAAAYAQESLELGERLNNPMILAFAKDRMGAAAVGQGQLAVGIQHAEDALHLFEKVESKEQVVRILPKLARYYKAAGRLEEALAMMQRHQAESEAFFQQERSKVISELQERYDAAARKREIELLAKENELKTAELAAQRLQQWISALAVLLLALFGVLVWQRYRRTARALVAERAAEQELQAALAKQRELNDMKNRFVSMTSHEFRTPLATILSSAELMREFDQALEPAARTEMLRQMEVAVHRLVEMLDNILLIGRADASRLEFSPHAVAVAEFCRELVEEVTAAHARDPRVPTVELDYVGSTGSCRVDPKLLRHILVNLLSNAVKYSPNGGVVRLRVDCQQDWIEFEVSDQGIGIPEKDLQRLFETFHRAGNVGSISGTGLGLAIVKKAVDLHGGIISVSSEIGKGTKFVVRLPLLPEFEPSVSAAPEL